MFADRTEAGRGLAERLRRFEGEPVVILALPRGGVPVAAEIARALGAPLDVIGVRKIGAPMQPELAIGAISEGAVRDLDRRMIDHLQIDDATIAAIESRERTELQRRLQHYRGDRGLPDLTGRTAIVVDDGLATGSTARAACRAVRLHEPDHLVLAVPVVSAQGLRSLRDEVDEVVYLEAPSNFMAVGQWYEDFRETTDDDVTTLLEEIGTPESRTS